METTHIRIQKITMNFLVYYSLSIVFLFALNIGYVSSQGNTYGSTIIFYKGPTLDNKVTYDLRAAHNVADDPNFYSTRKTMVFLHGWRLSVTTPASQTLLNAYLTNNTFNVLALDWSQAASTIFYSTALARVDPLGIEVALFIDRLNSQKGVPFSKVNLVGHSLGAHLGGSVGKFTLAWSGQTKYIDRITGLDPAIIANDFLQWRYARFVDIIHTDAYGFGTDQNTGHVDFWPNNGVAIQPGCPTSPITADEAHCSHNRSIYYLAESVVRANRTGNFLAVNRDNPSIIIEMGLNCPTSNVQGYYDLSTNAASWFSKS